jgi:hypothetical protein
MTRLLAILLFTAPAFADSGALATCEAQNMELVASNKNLVDLNAQLGAIAESFRSQLEARKVQVVRITPVAAKPVSNACPVLTGRQKCKPGRRQSVKHNCKCGVWTE